MAVRRNGLWVPAEVLLAASDRLALVTHCLWRAGRCFGGQSEGNRRATPRGLGIHLSRHNTYISS